MNFENFTIKSQEVVQQAVQLAHSAGNQAIEPVHLLQALMQKGLNSFSKRLVSMLA